MIQIDMPMPTNCLDCPACDEYLNCAIPINGRKWGENDVCEFDQGRPEWCPLKEQEAVKGHWIVLEFCANEGIYCSKCMNKIFDRSTKPKKKLSNYCPNCGSKNTHFFNPSTEKIMYSD